MRTLTRLLKSQVGFSLPEVLVAGAVMGGIALVTAKLMDDQASQQNHVRTMAAISQTVSRIESHLNNPEHCRQMLAGVAIGSSLGVSGTEDAVVVTNPGGSIRVIREGKHDYYNIPDDGVRVEDSVYGANIADLRIIFEPTKTTAFAGKRGVIIQRIPIVVQTNAGVIEECGPVLGDSNETAQKQMCESLRGTTDPDPFKGAVRWDTTQTPPRCVLNSVSCPFGQVATRMTSLGGIVCEDIQGQINLNEIFDFNGVNCSGQTPLNIRIINSGGKFKVTCF
jgi:hypothetical protein